MEWSTHGQLVNGFKIQLLIGFKIQIQKWSLRTFTVTIRNRGGSWDCILEAQVRRLS